MYILLEINLSAKYLKRCLFFCSLLVLMFFLRPLVAVPDGHAGVILQRGEIQKNVMSAGLHLRMPGYQRIVYLDCRVQQLEMQTSAASRDMQNINSTISLHYHINPSSAAELYRQAGMNYEYTLIVPIIQESLQSVLSSYSTKDLLSRNPEVVVQSSQIISRNLAEYNITVERFNILTYDFTPSPSSRLL